MNRRQLLGGACVAAAATMSFPSAAGTLIRPTDFGATGDGATDDAAAIQATLDSAATRGDVVVLEFDPGTYRLTRPIAVPASVSALTITGVGDVLLDAASASTAFVVESGSLLMLEIAGVSVAAQSPSSSVVGERGISMPTEVRDFALVLRDCSFLDEAYETAVVVIGEATAELL